MIKMLIVVVVCYTVCWLPFNVYWVSQFGARLLQSEKMGPFVFANLKKGHFGSIVTVEWSSPGFISKVKTRPETFSAVVAGDK